MREKFKFLLEKTFLFSGLKEETTGKIFSEIKLDILKFSSGETIFSPSDYEAKIGFVYSGECVAKRVNSEGNTVPLNTLHEGQSFGIMAVLSKEEFPTYIVSKGHSSVIFISKEEFYKILRRYPTVAMNVINFLAERVCFLNRKIATFSQDNVEKKLASYLTTYSNQNGLEVSLNCKQPADAINASRASLYRALTSLSESGLIKNENKKIIILNPEGLERLSK